ncbi:SRPBCC family protein [Hufsiella ginkgonis]|uniref:SRPBCC domain-containing protein n=1 Tax=Hufsiella ginkgonis TaxID=2695274 RepID=A0A7K1XSB6_9SPHI|nr:SRPBCC domain-containing protein [Hufsiella ginkgonis]MXV13757.1 SRPBCC domain-containing protein [Hufsiella ginkgonis]
MKRDLTIKWALPYPVEEVWHCLTDPEIISQWLMQNDFKAEVGHQFRFHTRPIPKMGFDGIVYCEVKEVVPLQKLVYTWKGGPKPGVIELDTLVTWTLKTTADGTEVTLVQAGFQGFKNYISSLFMGSGWRKKIRNRFAELLTSYADAHTES